MLDKLKALWTTVKAQLADIWNRSKIFLLAIVGLVLALEFQKLKEFFLAYMGQKEINKAETKDQNLASQENTTNVQADVLVKDAQELPKEEKPVDDDWYKKQKN